MFWLCQGSMLYPRRGSWIKTRRYWRSAMWRSELCWWGTMTNQCASKNSRGRSKELRKAPMNFPDRWSSDSTLEARHSSLDARPLRVSQCLDDNHLLLDECWPLWRSLDSITRTGRADLKCWIIHHNYRCIRMYLADFTWMKQF